MWLDDDATELPQLPFATTYQHDGSLWNPLISGDPELDRVVGHSYAADVIATSRALAHHYPECPNFLGLVLGSMIARGSIGPVEIGFLDRVARSANAGVLN
jgi:hypothetical protein